MNRPMTHHRQPLLALAAGLALAGPCCSPAGGQAAPPPQLLPVTAQWCLPQAGATPVGSSPVCIGLEVARTPQQQIWGLQRRAKLPPLRGMWFPYSTPTPVRFWMHLTPEPLDMLFVSNEQVVAVVANATPCMRLPCRNYGPGVPVDGVIELAGGEAARLGIRSGSPAVILPMATPLPASGR
ncbi:MAG: DUF192 domain-containing protein [Cyanobacteriota bacterium]|nr:DUF192 domain-containing protein [Cyanobacteriota bacterium]